MLVIYISVCVVILLLIWLYIKNKESFEPNVTTTCKSVVSWDCGGQLRVSTLNTKYPMQYLSSSDLLLTENRISDYNKTYRFPKIYNGRYFVFYPFAALYKEINYVRLAALLYMLRDKEGVQLLCKKINYTNLPDRDPSYISEIKSVKWLVNPSLVPLIDIDNLKQVNKPLRIILYSNKNATGSVVKTTADIPDLSVYKFTSSDSPVACIVVDNSS